MSKDIFSCFYCGGEIRSQKQNVDFRWGGDLFVVKNVPVFVCQQCGEKYYASKVSEKLDHIVQKKQIAKEFVKVPVFQWESISTSFRYA